MKAHRSRLFARAIVLLGAFALAGSVPGAAVSGEKGEGRGALAKLPLYFVKNEGQIDSKAAFMVKGPSSSIYFTRDGLVFDLQKGRGIVPRGIEKAALGSGKDEPARRLVFRLRFEGQAEDLRIEATNPQEAKVNYLIGSDPAKWKTGIPTFGSLVYRGVWPGVDLVFNGTEGRLKYEFHVAPGADPGKIRLTYEGIDGLKVSDAGDLVVRTAFGEMKDEEPYVYQEVEEKKVQVGARFKVAGKAAYGFDLDTWDKSFPMVIDPVLAYSTYLGGTDGDYGFAIAVDGSGNACVTGFTQSADFPTQTAYQGTYAAGSDVFVTKLSASGSSLVYSTYLGGSADDYGYGIAAATSGTVYVTGVTWSTDFPTQNPYQATNAGEGDTFVVKLSASGSSLVYSTYLGGGGDDYGTGIAINATGNPFVTGWTASSDFPTQNAYQGTFADVSDAFVTKLSSTGSSLVYSTYLGGADADNGAGIVVNSAGNAYVMGSTISTDFPMQNAYQGTCAGDNDTFVTKLSPSGSSLVYSTYLGGNGDDIGAGIAVDSSGNAYVTGWTISTNFPVQNPYQETYAEESDAFVTKLSASGSSLVYSTYLGGSGADNGAGIAVDSSGNAYVMGGTGSTDFPTRNAYQGANAGGIGTLDTFVTELSPSGSSLAFSTYLGGTGDDGGNGIAVDSSGNVYVVGGTSSTDFPAQNAYQSDNGGGSDGFVTKFLVCYSLTRSHTGSGGDPTASPPNSPVCPVGQYQVGAQIQLTASPDAGWSVGSWTGTDDDSSTLATNTVTMPASDQTVSVNYAGPPGPWDGATDLGGGWRWLAWFGFFNVSSDPWIYHEQLDWMFVYGTSPSDLWIYYPRMAAWLWTSNTAFPFLYRATEPYLAWLYYLEWTTNPVWFHNQTTDMWEAY